MHKLICLFEKHKTSILHILVLFSSKQNPNNIPEQEENIHPFTVRLLSLIDLF